MAVTVVFGAIRKGRAVIENLAEILKPATVHYRAMGKDERSTEIHVLHHLQGRQGLAKTHLGIPQHLVALLVLLLELLLGLLYGLTLFRTEYNRALVM